FFIAVPKTEKRLKILLIVSLLIALVARFLPAPEGISAAGDGWMWTRFASHNRFDALLVGVLLYLLSSEINFKEYFKPSRIEVNIISIIAMLGIFILPGIFVDSQVDRFNHLIFELCSGVLLLLSVLNTGHLLDFKFITPILNWIGSRSYGLYLIHIPAEMFVYELTARGLILSNSQSLILWMILTLSATELCYRLIEKPLINYSRRPLPVLLNS
ncbi:MAG: hypothetical protein H7281_19450, partial [Bacteriovorax sp.]|nr:hypothetical protein [Bacteriovorax sp.]